MKKKEENLLKEATKKYKNLLKENGMPNVVILANGEKKHMQTVEGKNVDLMLSLVVAMADSNIIRDIFQNAVKAYPFVENLKKAVNEFKKTDENDGQDNDE